MDPSRIIFFSNIPTPYRVHLLSRFKSCDGLHIFEVYQNKNENRNWSFELNRETFFLRGISLKFSREIGYLHFNLGIRKLFNEINPKLVIVTNLKPSSIIAIFYSIILKCKLVYMTDGIYESEFGFRMKIYQPFLRRFLFPFFNHFICTGTRGKALLFHYGISESAISVVPLASHLSEVSYPYVPINDREYDIIYSGRIDNLKNIDFLISVLEKLSYKLPLKILICGDGEKRLDLLNVLKSLPLKFDYKGVVNDPKELSYYHSISKFALFPSLGDVWGLSINDAMHFGCCVVSSKFVGCVPDLLKDGINGLTLDLRIDLWVDKIFELIKEATLINHISLNAVKDSGLFSTSNSALCLTEVLNKVCD